MRVPLSALAFARSGDKGRSSNVGVVALSAAVYPFLRQALTAERVAAHFAALWAPLPPGRVERYELPHLRALNFILNGSLGEGGSGNLRLDAQGKIHGEALLLLELELPAGLALPP